MKRVAVSILIACAACGNDGQASDHADETEPPTSAQAQAAFPAVYNQILSAFADLHQDAEHQGGTSEPLYTFMGDSRCGNRGNYSGGGTLEADDIDFQGVFEDCQDQPYGALLDGVFEYQFEVVSTSVFRERIRTNIAIGYGSENDTIEYIDCQSDLTLTHDGSSTAGTGRFCNTPVDDSWSYAP